MSGAVNEQEKVMSEAKELVVNDRRHHVPADVPSGGGTLMETLASAVQRGLPVETLNALMEFQEKQDAFQARKAFDAAMSDLRSDLPEIVKNKRVGFEHKSGEGSTNYSHETLDAVTNALSPAMAKHGLAFRWRVDNSEQGKVRVTCIISHRDGHSEETSLCAAPDSSGKKNAIQQVGSTVTYLQRYTLKAAVGVAASNDDDGAGSDEAVNDPQEEAAPLLDMIDKTPRDELAGLNEKVKAEAEKRKLSQAAFGLVRAHYSARLNREKELANAE